MAASYPGTIKTFSTKASGEAIASSHINDLQNEIVAVETQLGVNAGTWQSYTPSLSWTGGTTDPTSATFDYAKYTQIGKMVTVQFILTVVRGSGDRVFATIGLPINSSVHGLAGTGVEDLTSALRQPFNVSSYAFDSVTAYPPSAMSRDGSMRITFTYPIA